MSSGTGLLACARGPEARATYCTKTVTPDWLGTPPTVITTGTWPLTPAGTCTVTAITPATTPVTPPADCTAAVLPPIVTATGSAGRGGTGPATLPSTPAGVVCPSPVAVRVSSEPTAAG